MGASEDEAEVERVLAGELGAFEHIVRRWQAPLVNLAYRFCHDRSRDESLQLRTQAHTGKHRVARRHCGTESIGRNGCGGDGPRPRRETRRLGALQ